MQDGIPGQVEKNPEKAVEYLMVAAQAGDADAMHAIAVVSLASLVLLLGPTAF